MEVFMKKVTRCMDCIHNKEGRCRNSTWWLSNLLGPKEIEPGDGCTRGKKREENK